MESVTTAYSLAKITAGWEDKPFVLHGSPARYFQTRSPALFRAEVQSGLIISLFSPFSRKKAPIETKVDKFLLKKLSIQNHTTQKKWELYSPNAWTRVLESLSWNLCNKILKEDGKMNPLTMYNTYLLVKLSENDIWVRRKSYCIARWSLPLFQNKIVGFG